MDLKGIPLSGQGEPLPDACPYAGEWLHRGMLFLYRSGGSASLVDMAAEFQTSDGHNAIGISADQLAAILQVSIDDLFDHNRAGTLYFVRGDNVPPRHGGTWAKRYIFQIGDTQNGIIVEQPARGGTA